MSKLHMRDLIVSMKGNSFQGQAWLWWVSAQPQLALAPCCAGVSRVCRQGRCSADHHTPEITEITWMGCQQPRPQRCPCPKVQDVDHVCIGSWQCCRGPAAARALNRLPWDQSLLPPGQNTALICFCTRPHKCLCFLLSNITHLCYCR